MATDPRLPRPLARTLRYCVTCNARERVIEHGKCVVCGNDPMTRTLHIGPLTTRATTDPPTVLQWFHDRFAGWTRLDFYCLVMCVLATVYLAIHVVLWAW